MDGDDCDLTNNQENRMSTELKTYITAGFIAKMMVTIIAIDIETSINKQNIH